MFPKAFRDTAEGESLGMCFWPPLMNPQINLINESTELQPYNRMTFIKKNQKKGLFMIPEGQMQKGTKNPVLEVVLLYNQNGCNHPANHT